jgi:hypothetical protein
MKMAFQKGLLPLGAMLVVAVASALAPARAGADPVPTVTFAAPAPDAVFTGAQAISLQVTAVDSNGIRNVQILAGDRPLCLDTVAPFLCTFTPTAEDLGSVTFVAIATNGVGAQAIAVRTVHVNPTRPLGLTMRTSVRRQGRSQDKLLTSGVLRLPPGDFPSFCGQGAVQVQYSYGATHSFFLAYVNRQCRFSTPVVLINGAGSAVKRVLVQALFLGSRSLTGSSPLRQLVSLTRRTPGKGAARKH